MTITELRWHATATPFVPFRIITADAAGIDVPHPDYIFLPPTESRLCCVAFDDATLKVIDAFLVPRIEISPVTATEG